jgi:transposase
MISQRMVFEIYRLSNEGYSVRRIARTLNLNRKTVFKYLEDPNPKRSVIKRPSKLDPFKQEISNMLDIDPKASAVVICQRITSLGFDGEITILRDYLRKIRGKSRKKQPFIRFESPPGQQCQIDWGHFGSITYGNTSRKLYCMAVIESYSRLLYLEFTHSQKQETLHRCLLNAFRCFNGTPKELVHDNMITAVIERDGPLIRFNEAFLHFLMPFKIIPIACNVARPHEKGKVEKGAIHYIRHNFFPLRSFRDLKDIQGQADHWRDHVANVRVHSTTGQKPVDRFKVEDMRPLPELLPDCRDTSICRVYPDFSIHFDGNSYTVPPWAIDKQVIAKADHYTLTIYYRDKPIAVHTRSWERKKRIELPSHREAARKHQRRIWRSQEVAAFISLGEEAKIYIEKLTAANQPIKKNIKKLLAFKDEYGAFALIEAIKKASLHKAYGAHYIENILYQEMTPSKRHPPVRVKQENLNHIRLQEPSLAQYDAFIIKRRKNHD